MIHRHFVTAALSATLLAGFATGCASESDPDGAAASSANAYVDSVCASVCGEGLRRYDELSCGDSNTFEGCILACEGELFAAPLIDDAACYAHLEASVAAVEACVAEAQSCGGLEACAGLVGDAAAEAEGPCQEPVTEGTGGGNVEETGAGGSGAGGSTSGTGGQANSCEFFDCSQCADPQVEEACEEYTLACSTMPSASDQEQCCQDHVDFFEFTCLEI